VRVFDRQIIHKNLISSMKISRYVNIWLMLAVGRFNVRYLDSETMRKRRTIAPIEPIKGDTVLLTDIEGGLDR
jgi:hypothetical protein